MSNVRRFLIKVHARDCPSEDGQPKDPADWEDKKFKTGLPQKSRQGKPLEQTRNPEPGDKLLIWVNDRQYGGTGLTATAEVREFQIVDETVAVRSVSLLPNPRLNNTDLKEPNEAPAVHEIAISRKVKLRPLTTEGWQEIYDAAQLKAQLSKDAAQELARQKKLGEQATRRGQQDFSKTMRNSYKGRCAITGCATSDALQAAHIRVLKNRDDNHAQNGLLLRSDIHALFDALLITLSTDGKTVKISHSLTDPSYAYLENAKVFQPEEGLRPSQKNIQDHRKRFFSKEKQRNELQESSESGSTSSGGARVRKLAKVA
jgi:hypothetical protein